MNSRSPRSRSLGRIGLLLALLGMPALGWAQSVLENPPPNGDASGIGLVSGWTCAGAGAVVEVAFNGGARMRVPAGGARADTLATCGRSDTGFGLLLNFNLLGTGSHSAQLFVNGSAAGGPVTFRVTTLGSEFVRGAAATVDVPNFPVAGRTTTLRWQQASQNFVVAGLSGVPASNFPPSSTLAQQCAPANSLAPAANRTGSLDTERRWVRSHFDEKYLWYAEVPTVDSSLPQFNLADVYASLDNYFDALRTPAVTPSGKRKDQFSFTYPTAQWQALSESGVSAGFGIEWVLRSAVTPRDIRVAYVEPNSPASAASVGRGAQLVAVDGVSVNDNTQAGVDTLNRVLFGPTPGQSYTFVLREVGAASDRTVTMVAAQITSQPVLVASVLAQPGGNVGYLVFNEHILPAEGQLVTAFRQFALQGVRDLVLDLRYNGGGYLYQAAQVAYMIAGAARTAGRVFYALQFNDKRAADTSSADARTPFYNGASGFPGTGTTANAALPALDLARVFVLVSAGTCSASEAIINGLRGIGVQVVLIGAATCGKPYGFFPTDNCGITYFPTEFRGVNDAGFGDYADGFAPTCFVADDLGRALGNPAESMLAAALTYRTTGACPPGTSAGGRLKSIEGGAEQRVLRHPVRESLFGSPGPR